MRAQSAFQTLVALDSYCRRGDVLLANQHGSETTISAVRFKLGGYCLAAPFSELAELLESPTWTRLPRVKPWVRGVTNLRGKLLPVIDLAEFLGVTLKTAPKKQRVLVMNKYGVFVGLLVDEVIGMHHFPRDSHVDELDVVGDISAYLDGSYRDGDELWGVFRPAQLARDTKFLAVTV